MFGRTSQTDAESLRYELVIYYCNRLPTNNEQQQPKALIIVSSSANNNNLEIVESQNFNIC